ncbi:MAG: DUF3618 domain-containing protein [Parerythrobacter sp.]
MDTQNQHDDPDAIERDIKKTQREMSATVDRLSDQMTPRKILDQLLDKTENGDIDGRQLLDQAKRNPLALAMIGGGLLWLLSDKDATPSGLKPDNMPFAGDDDYSAEWDSHDRYHRGYVEHMSSVEPGDGEDDASYRLRRNRARANYLMIEQNHDEDEKSFHDRLNTASDALRDKRDALTNRAGDARRSAKAQMKSAVGSTTRAYDDNPLAGGLIAAAIGAIAGSAIPLSRTEQDKLGDVGEQAVEKAKSQAQDLAGKAREKKDELVKKADQKIDEKA